VSAVRAAGFRVPAKSLRQHALLMALLPAAGTFYQVCERAGIDIDLATSEIPVRHLFEVLMKCGAIRLDGILYALTPPARAALMPAAVPSGSIATAHYRGPNLALPVTIVRRAANPGASA
jgi:hypothetical protein